MTKALIFKLGTLESCSPVIIAGFGVIGGWYGQSAIEADLSKRSARCPDERLGAGCWAQEGSGWAEGMTKALIVKLGAPESCSPAASADFGMIGGTDRQDGSLY